MSNEKKALETREEKAEDRHGAIGAQNRNPPKNFPEEFPRGEIEIGLLIGEPHYSQLVETGVVFKGQPDEPIAIQMQTKVGLVLAGSYPKKYPRVMVTKKSLSLEDQDLSDQFRRFCTVEAIGNTGKDSNLTHEEELAKDLMNQITKYDKQNGHWITGLLWKEKEPQNLLSNNRNRAVAVARSIVKKYTATKKDSDVKAKEKENILIAVDEAY